MIRLYDGSKILDIEMYEDGFGEYDEVEFFADGGIWSRDDVNSDRTVYRVEDADYCVEYADDWEKCVGDFCYDFDEFVGKRHVTITRWSYVLVCGGEDDGKVVYVGTERGANEYAKKAQAEAVVFYLVFNEDGEEVTR